MMKALIKGRREFITKTVVTAAGSFAAVALSGIPRVLASSSQKSKAKPQPSTQAAEDSLVIQSALAQKQLAVLQQAADECTKKGEICHEHCQKQIAAGVKDFSHCDIAVQQMVVFSQAVSKLASLKSVRIYETLTPAMAAAEACKKACEAHKGHGSHEMHTECKECATACDQFLAACTELKKISV
jgi:hypothetical protein